MPQAALGKGFGRRWGEDRIKIKPNREKNSIWGRYHGRLHWGCFFCSAYYTGFVVALWLRQKNMVLVLMLGSRGSKKMTVLFQPQPSPQTRPSPQAQSPRRGRKEECCPSCWTPSFPPEAIEVVRDVPKFKCEWTARAIRKETEGKKAAAQRGGENPPMSTNKKYLVKENETWQLS